MSHFARILLLLILIFPGISSMANQSNKSISTSFYVVSSHVLVDSPELAAVGAELIRKGEDISRIAMLWSKDASTAMKGGYQGIELCSAYIPVMAEFLCSQPVGHVGIVRSPFGWHIAIVHTRGAELKDLVVQRKDSFRPPMIFSASLTITCVDAGARNDPLRLELDEKNGVAKVNGMLSLLVSADSSFRIITSSGFELFLLRDSGVSLIKKLGEGGLGIDLDCRPVGRRLF